MLLQKPLLRSGGGRNDSRKRTAEIRGKAKTARWSRLPPTALISRVCSEGTSRRRVASICAGCRQSRYPNFWTAFLCRGFWLTTFTRWLMPMTPGTRPLVALTKSKAANSIVSFLTKIRLPRFTICSTARSRIVSREPESWL